MELSSDAILYSKLGKENSDSGHYQMFTWAAFGRRFPTSGLWLGLLLPKSIATLILYLTSNEHLRSGHIFRRGQQFCLIRFFSCSEVETR